MTVGDKGTAIVIDAGGFVLTGSTATLIAAPGSIDTGGALRLTPLAISADGLTAAYTTTGTDFLQGGSWQFQLEVQTAANQVFSSAPAPVYIYPLLSP